ncbi:MAG TPA: hypothetical protein VKJ65_02640, partial [Phycisphaerae bacterium]|nr:hypothetical protein [Phycisphaerae bacterium]
AVLPDFALRLLPDEGNQISKAATSDGYNIKRFEMNASAQFEVWGNTGGAITPIHQRSRTK